MNGDQGCSEYDIVFRKALGDLVRESNIRNVFMINEQLGSPRDSGIRDD
jgi:hypothetical protein